VKKRAFVVEHDGFLLTEKYETIERIDQELRLHEPAPRSVHVETRDAATADAVCIEPSCFDLGRNGKRRGRFRRRQELALRSSAREQFPVGYSLGPAHEDPVVRRIEPTHFTQTTLVDDIGAVDDMLVRGGIETDDELIARLPELDTRRRGEPEERLVGAAALERGARRRIVGELRDRRWGR